jgi:metallophosphoesterase (TIGR03767 family)
VGRGLRGFAAAFAALTVALCAASAAAHEALHGDSTLDHTVVGNDPAQGFSFLRIGPGEPYAVRTDVSAALPQRDARRRSLIYLGQIADTQLADEESPARVEFLDPEPSGAGSAAWRPQEALTPHLTDFAIRQMNEFVTSPVRQGDGTRASMVNVVLSGDLADNQHRNETEWVRILLEGGLLDPNSGTSDLSGTSCPPGTPLDDPANYTGVQDYDDYANDAPHFYDPDQPFGQYADWPKYPGLMDRAQKPFMAEGLKVPSYVLFGNHDGLAQGNEDANQGIERIATGCVKPIAQGPGTTAFDALDPSYLTGVFADPAKVMLVPPDQRRQFVDKLQFKAIFDTMAQEDDHGFKLVEKAELDASGGTAAYYTFNPKPGVRYVVLDTLSEGGVVGQSNQGNVDDAQFQWFEKQLRDATARDELVIVHAHHASGSLTADVPDEVAAECGPEDAHGHATNPGCDRDPRDSQPLHLGAEVQALMHTYPHAIAYVAGHSHESRVAPLRSEGKSYWEIKSPAIADWPPQNRAIEVMDNCDGTLSIFGTMLDTANRVNAPAPGTNAGALDAETLASIGRVLNYNDPQYGPGSPGSVGPEGQPIDRNVELLLKDPRRSPGACGSSGGGGDGGGGGTATTPKLKLSVKPKRVRGGRRTCFRFRVTARGRVVQGASIRFAGRRATSGKIGTKSICRRLYRTKTATVKKKGFKGAKAKVTILRRRR